MNRTIKNIILCLMMSMTLLAGYQMVQTSRNVSSPMNDHFSQQTSSFPEKPTEPLQEGMQPSTKMSYFHQDTFLWIGIALLFSICLIYLWLSKANQLSLKETFKTKNKIIIALLAITLLTENITLFALSYNNKTPSANFSYRPEENTPKDTTKDDVKQGTVVNDQHIDLSAYDSNITINQPGHYILTGQFEHTIIIDASDAVTLELDHVTIQNQITATIINLSHHALTLHLKENTINTLSDGGSSEYDACIYSYGPLFIEGDGQLNVYGNQQEGEGIATETNHITINGGNIHIESQDDGINAGGDGGTITINQGQLWIKASGDGIDSNQDLVIQGGTIYVMGSAQGGDAGLDTETGYTIHGGTIVALGSDMLEKPASTSTQKTLCFTLDNTIQKGTLVALLNDQGETIIAFEAQEDFRTLIISDPSLNTGDYTLYQGGQHTGQSDNDLYLEGTYQLGTIVTKTTLN